MNSESEAVNFSNDEVSNWQVIQNPVRPTVDLRDMVRRDLIRRSLGYMDEAGKRRQQALRTDKIKQYQSAVRQSVRDFYGQLPIKKKNWLCYNSVTELEFL